MKLGIIGGAMEEELILIKIRLMTEINKLKLGRL